VLAQRAASEGPRWTRAVEDQSAPIPEEVTSELGGIIRTETSCGSQRSAALNGNASHAPCNLAVSASNLQPLSYFAPADPPEAGPEVEPLPEGSAFIISRNRSCHFPVSLRLSASRIRAMSVENTRVTTFSS
jgi:hypothetical protein